MPRCCTGYRARSCADSVYWCARRRSCAGTATCSATYQGLAALLADGVDNEASELHASCVRMAGIGERLVASAIEAGAVRPGVTGADVFTLMNAGAWTREHASVEQATRLVAFTLDGLLTLPSR